MRSAFPFLCLSIFCASHVAFETLPSAEKLVGADWSKVNVYTVVKFHDAYLQTILKLGRFPNMVHCTASFIAPNAMISAAHCFNRPSRSRVILEIHPSDSKKWIARGRLHINPEYNSNRWSNVADLAIVVFDSDLPDVKPLVIDGAPVNCSEKLQIWGYGRQTERENVLNELVDLFKNPKLKMANVSVPTGCQMKRISTDTIVTETERVTICHGDSGGALTRANKLVGIISSGEAPQKNMCMRGSRNYHIQVDQYLEWIKVVAPKAIIDNYQTSRVVVLSK